MKIKEQMFDSDFAHSKVFFYDSCAWKDKTDTETVNKNVSASKQAFHVECHAFLCFWLQDAYWKYTQQRKC